MTNSRVWFITGSSSGFGRAIVDAARARGERVVATARRPDAMADMEGDDVIKLGLDVTREEQIEPALEEAVERFGRIDVLVNNAGIGYVGALEEMMLPDLREVMDTMFFGPAALTRAVVPRMRAQGSAAIVQISSMGGQVTAPGYSAYCASKACWGAACGRRLRWMPTRRRPARLAPTSSARTATKPAVRPRRRQRS